MNDTLKSQKYQYAYPKLGSYFRIVISSEDTIGLHKAVTQSYDLVDQLDLVFSDYKDNSECSMLSQAQVKQWINVSDAMFDVLKESVKACKKSKGQFNVTIGRVTKTWRNEMNSDQRNRKIDSLLPCVRCDNFLLEHKTKKIRKNRDCYDFDFGGIAKGYILQKVSDHLKSLGFNRHLIDAGGDLLLADPPLATKGWKIKIEGQEKTLTLKNLAIVTSGNTYQSYEEDTPYNTHIIDPISKDEYTNKKNSVTVISKNPMRADWMATWKFMSPSKKSIYRE